MKLSIGALARATLTPTLTLNARSPPYTQDRAVATLSFFYFFMSFSCLHNAILPIPRFFVFFFFFASFSEVLIPHFHSPPHPRPHAWRLFSIVSHVQTTVPAGSPLWHPACFPTCTVRLSQRAGGPGTPSSALPSSYPTPPICDPFTRKAPSLPRTFWSRQHFSLQNNK